MARKLAYSVDVREYEPVDADRPELGQNVVRQQFFLAGDTLPRWAAKLVGDHVFGDNEDDGTEDAPETWSDKTLPELKDEIDKRNAGREDDAKLSKTGRKATLVAALEADDAASAPSA